MRCRELQAVDVSHTTGHRATALQAAPIGALGRVGYTVGRACGVAGGAAGLFSVVFRQEYAQSQVDAFCDGLKLFKIGYSWGGPVSLVVPYNIASMRQAWPVHLKPGTLVRFSTGLESSHDLILDLHQAVQAHLPMA